MVRFKNRWLLVEFIPCDPTGAKAADRTTNTNATESLTSKQIWSALKQSVILNFGDVGWGAVGTSLTIKYFSPITNLCIIRVARDNHCLAWASVTLLSSLEGQKYIPNVVHVSGTIKQAQLAAIQHNREVVARFRARANTPATYQDSYESFLQSSTQEIQALQD